jgi:HSP90 family molecular chaperone
VGVIEDEANRKTLAELLRFSTSQSGDTTASLAEYVGRMKEGQKSVYFVSANSKVGSGSVQSSLQAQDGLWVC